MIMLQSCMHERGIFEVIDIEKLKGKIANKH